MYPRLTSITIRGYRPFRELVAPLGPLEVLVGANGTGKSSFFEFLRFLRDSVDKDIPPEIVEGNVGIQLFHRPGPQRLGWALQLAGEGETVSYEGELMGPVGSARLVDERAFVVSTKSEQELLLERGAWQRGALVSDQP